MRTQFHKKSQNTSKPSAHRLAFLQYSVYLLFFGIFIRLAFWQIVKRDELQVMAESQYTSSSKVTAVRGKIISADGYVLVDNKDVFTLFAQPHVLLETPNQIAQKIAPLIADDPGMASLSAEVRNALVSQSLTDKISKPEKKWVALKNKVNKQQKEQIEALKILGLGFDQYQMRDYPEASLAAHITGFVGKDSEGNDTGYFGIEGMFNRELEGKSGNIIRQKSARGVPLFFTKTEKIEAHPGRDIVLTIRRDVQFTLEQKLKKGIEKYGAISGEVVVMDPKTGNILGMAAFPHYDQQTFYNFPTENQKNPLVAEAYEPGSTFKALTVAAGIDAGVVTPDTPCPRCVGPREIAGYELKTWNEVYTPNISIRDGLAKSDNTAMIFVGEALGRDKFLEYLDRFQIGDPTEIELQEDTKTPLKDEWRPIDVATASFGQGIVTTGMQMTKAVGAIANDGVMMKPKIVRAVVVDGQEIPVEDKIAGTPISEKSADTVTDMMVHAAAQGEAKWAVLKEYTIAGKTGTAQIPVAGHYDEDKTIASFVGFAPAQDPKFVMLVKLREPKSSQWASETAAPLWYDIAQELFLQLNILPDKK